MQQATTCIVNTPLHNTTRRCTTSDCTSVYVAAGCTTVWMNYANKASQTAQPWPGQQRQGENLLATIPTSYGERQQRDPQKAHYGTEARHMMQRWSKSAKPLQRYLYLWMLQYGGRPPSWIGKTHNWTTHEEYVFYRCAKFGWNGPDSFENASFLLWQFGMKMPIHAPRCFLGICPPKWEMVMTGFTKGTTMHRIWRM